MKINVEKKLLNGEIIRTEELHFTLPQKVLADIANSGLCLTVILYREKLRYIILISIVFLF